MTADQSTTHVDAAAVRARVRPPTFPDRTFRVTDFGAVGDGRTDDTAAFQAAIAACHTAGGGHVVVEAGTFRTGAIRLLSDVDLHVGAEAVIRFRQEPHAY